MNPSENNEDLDLGTAGASARREHERRTANRERRVREQHPRVGGVLLALQDEPRHQQVWARGAGGEERVAAALAKRLDKGIVVLHDRRIPGSRANIDHIAIAPSGVWVIDSKRYKGKVAVSSPLFGQTKLTIAGRDKSKLIDGLDKQVALVREQMRTILAEAPIHGALCFIDAGLPLLGSVNFRGYPLLYPTGLAKRINARGSLSAEAVGLIATELAKPFRSA